MKIRILNFKEVNDKSRTLTFTALSIVTYKDKRINFLTGNESKIGDTVIKTFEFAENCLWLPSMKVDSMENFKVLRSFGNSGGVRIDKVSVGVSYLEKLKLNVWSSPLEFFFRPNFDI